MASWLLFKAKPPLFVKSEVPMLTKAFLMDILSSFWKISKLEVIGNHSNQTFFIVMSQFI